MSGFEDHRPPNSMAEVTPPQRVVSLVPSLTESLFDLGLGESVVGITDYCCFPETGVAGLPRVGGTKTPEMEEIFSLEPDLILANREENSRQVIEALQERGARVWLSFPKSVHETIEVLFDLAKIFQSQSAYLQVDSLERAVEWSRAANQDKPPIPYFCPIWYGESESGEPWWMSFNRHTYASDLLALFGGQNVFADRERAYPLAADLGRQPAQAPGDRDVRYPRIGFEEILGADPELLLMPSEPYPFSEEEARSLTSRLEDATPEKVVHVRHIDGSLITWPGTRLGKALQALPEVITLQGG